MNMLSPSSPLSSSLGPLLFNSPLIFPKSLFLGSANGAIVILPPRPTTSLSRRSHTLLVLCACHLNTLHYCTDLPQASLLSRHLPSVPGFLPGFLSELTCFPCHLRFPYSMTAFWSPTSQTRALFYADRCRSTPTPLASSNPEHFSVTPLSTIRRRQIL
jgi:hypothetical protein